MAKVWIVQEVHRDSPPAVEHTTVYGSRQRAVDAVEDELDLVNVDDDDGYWLLNEYEVEE